MRLIDADALSVHKAYCVDEAGWGANFYVVDKSDIDNATTIDAVPVVRCKDCKKRSPSVNSPKNAIWCREFRAYMPCNGFCSYGEKCDKEDKSEC